MSAPRDETLDLSGLRRRMDGQARAPLLAEPRGAAGDAGVPRLPAPRVPGERVRAPGPRGPPAVPEDHGRVDGAGRPHRLHPPAGGEDRPLRARAGGHDPRPAAVLRHRAHGRRLRHRRPRREPHGPADQDRRQPRAPGEPRRHRRAGPGRHPQPLRSRPVADPHLPRRHPGLGRLRRPPSAARSTRSAAWAAPGCASSPRRSRRRPSPRSWTRSSRSSRRRSGTSGSRAAPTARARARVLAFGRPVDTRYDFTRANVVLTLDADFASAGPGRLRYIRDHAATRKLDGGRTTMSRLYAVESAPGLMGSQADHRLRLKPSEVEDVRPRAGRGAGRRRPRPALGGVDRSAGGGPAGQRRARRS